MTGLLVLEVDDVLYSMMTLHWCILLLTIRSDSIAQHVGIGDVRFITVNIVCFVCYVNLVNLFLMCIW